MTLRNKLRIAGFALLVWTVIAVGMSTAFGQAPAATAATTTPVPVNVLKLSKDDQRQLELASERLGQMKAQLEDAKKQQLEAQAKLQEANAFISQYNQVEAARMAFFFRIAADVCKCESSTLEFSADGKNIVHKAKDSKP